MADFQHNTSGFSFTALLGALNLSSEAIIVYEPVADADATVYDMRIAMLNDAAVRMFGVPRETAVGALLSALWPIDKEEESWQKGIEVLYTGKPQKYEWLTMGFGEPRWFEVQLQEYNGHLAAAYHDITDRKRSFMSSQAQRSFFEELMSEGISRKAVLSPVRDATGRIENFHYDFANYGRGIEDGYRGLPLMPIQVEGRLLTEVVPSVRQSPVWPFLCGMAETGEAGHLTLDYQNDGYDTQMEVSGKRLEDGRLLLDLMETGAATRLATELRAEQAKLNAVLQAVPVGITVFEAVRAADGSLTDLRLAQRNDLALELSRIPPELYQVGGLLSRLMPKELSENFERMLDVVRTGRPLMHELYQPHLDKWILSRINPHGDGLLSTIQDITDIKRYGQEKNRQAKMLGGVLEASPNGITVFEAIRDEAGEVVDFRIAHANELVIRISGYSREDYMRLSFFERLPAQRAELPRLKKLIAEGKSDQTEQYITATGKWILVTVTPLGDGFVTTVQDITARRQQQEEVQLSARTLEGVLQASPHAILVFEAMRNAGGSVEDFRIIRFNQRATAATGLDTGSLINATLFGCMPSLRERLPHYVAVIESGRQESYEFFNEQLAMWRRITNTPLGDGFVMTMEDITEQKNISGQIEESAKLLNAVLDNTPVAVVVYESIRDNDGDIVDFRPIIANQLALSTSGYTLESFMAQTILERSQEARNEVASLIAVVRDRVHKTHEHQVASSGRWVRAITTAFGDGFIATAQDITEQRAQSKLIEEQATLFNGVLSSLQNGLAIYRIIRDDAGKLEDLEYIQVADSVLRDTGRTREAMLGTRIRSAYPGIEGTDYWTAYRRVAEHGEPASFETHFTLPGYDNYLLNWVTPIGDDKLVNVYYIVNDLKRAQQELEHTVHELRRSNEDLEQFASIASHDLQEPLRKVQSFGAMLESRYADALGEGGRDLVQRMQSAAGRMRNLVTGLLSFARLSGDENLPLSAVDLHTLLAEIAADLDQTAEATGGAIIIPARLPFVHGIESQLRHLFHNLLTNAFKFRKAGVAPLVTVTVAALKPGDAERLSPLALADNYLRFEIRDNGIGFEPEFAEKIFGLFERLHGMSEYQGTGLGLSICRRVAERHGGTIRAESRLGEGATFIVLLQKA